MINSWMASNTVQLFLIISQQLDIFYQQSPIPKPALQHSSRLAWTQLTNAFVWSSQKFHILTCHESCPPKNLQK